ncbi:MAG: hypothetical protein ACREC9_06635 [Methylocella sp.]
MRFQSRPLLAAALLVALTTSPAFAWQLCLPFGLGCIGGGGSGGGGGGGGGTAVPGPIAGAGLGYLVLAGGYYVVRRWRKHNNGE